MSRALPTLLLSLCLIGVAAGQETVDAAKAETLALARSRLPAEGVKQVAEAIRFAESAHHGQMRDGGRPALLHVLRVAREVLRAPGGASANTVAAAVLHDTVEDTKVTKRQLQQRFGRQVAELVEWVTLDELSKHKNDKTARERAYYERFSKAPRGAAEIKFHDRLDNIRDMKSFEVAGKVGYLGTTRETVIKALAVKHPDLAKALDAEVKKELARWEAQLGAGADLLARYRRADGTVRWKAAVRDGVMREGSALARFTLALFLKELAVVVRTGDRLRIEEFFEGLATTDFFVHYGLFAVGARGGEVLYARYLQRHVRPGFVGGLLKANVALATGLALPQIARGELKGEAFAISLTALGLSSTAIRAGLRGLSWVSGLDRARRAGSFAKLGLKLGKLGNVAGWVYAVGETVVVLTLADAIEQRLTAWRDGQKARAAMGEAGQAFLTAAAKPGVTPEQLQSALGTYQDAWNAYREFLYAPVLQQEALLNARLGKSARTAKLMADERAAALTKLSSTPAVKRSLERRYGSLEQWSDARAAADNAKLEAKLKEILTAHTHGVDAGLKQVYAVERRDGGYLSDLEAEDRARLVGHDPHAGRDDPFARWSRDRSASRQADALSAVSPNRIQTYADELAALALARTAVGNEPDLIAVLARAEAIARRAHELETTFSRKRGLAAALEDSR